MRRPPARRTRRPSPPRCAWAQRRSEVEVTSHSSRASYDAVALTNSSRKSNGTCAACGAAALVAHLQVADASGESLIPTTDKFGAALSDIVRCEECGHGQLARMPSEVEHGEAYGEAASDDYVEVEEGQRATARIALDRIERHTGGPGALLDLGCWVGFLLSEADQRDWKTLGVEPS